MGNVGNSLGLLWVDNIPLFFDLVVHTPITVMMFVTLFVATNQMRDK